MSEPLKISVPFDEWQQLQRDWQQLHRDLGLPKGCLAGGSMPGTTRRAPEKQPSGSSIAPARRGDERACPVPPVDRSRSRTGDRSNQRR